MTESEYLHLEHHAEPFISVFVYEHAGVDRRDPAVQAFRADATARMVPEMSIAIGPDDVPAGAGAPLLSFRFEREHLAVSEEILGWPRLHPLVRHIETDRHLPPRLPDAR